MGTWGAATRYGNDETCVGGQVGGGGKRDRTADLLHAMQALSQLSYTPHGQHEIIRGDHLVQTAGHRRAAHVTLAPARCDRPPQRARRRSAIIGADAREPRRARPHCPPCPIAPMPTPPEAVPIDLAGRVIMVTGATGGLGRPLALACAAAGATVVLHGRVVRKLEALYDEIVAAGPSRSRRSFRSTWPRQTPTISATSRARSARSSAGWTASCTRRPSWARWARSSTSRSTVAEGAARQPGRRDGADPRRRCRCSPPRRTRASSSRSTRAAGAARLLGRVCARRRPALAALAATLADEWEKPREPARQCRRARADALAAARADASGRGQVGAAAVRRAGAAVPASAGRAAQAESGAGSTRRHGSPVSRPRRWSRAR